MGDLKVERSFTRGSMVRHKLIPTGNKNFGRVLTTTCDYRSRSWVAVAWEGGMVSCVRPRNLELLREETAADETPRG